MRDTRRFQGVAAHQSADVTSTTTRRLLPDTEAVAYTKQSKRQERGLRAQAKDPDMASDPDADDLGGDRDLDPRHNADTVHVLVSGLTAPSDLAPRARR